MKKILVPVDFSQNSLNAVRVAAEIARKSGAALELLHVNMAVLYSAPFAEYSSSINFEAEDKIYDQRAAEGLDSLRQDILAESGFDHLNITTRVEEGFLHTNLRNVAGEDGADLVVMGTKGASGVGEFLIGSNTEKVIRTATCPVLAVPESVAKFDPKMVLLPSTLKKDQAQVFRYLAEWQNWFDFNTKVLYLNNPIGVSTDGSAEAEKNRMAESAGLKKTDVIITSETFFEDDTILSAAEQWDADLIVMGTHQRKGLSHFLFGSVTEDTVNHSRLPVLAVPLG